MAARFPRGKQPEFPVHCTGTRKLSNIISFETSVFSASHGFILSPWQYLSSSPQCAFFLSIQIGATSRFIIFTIAQNWTNANGIGKADKSKNGFPYFPRLRNFIVKFFSVPPANVKLLIQFAFHLELVVAGVVPHGYFFLFICHPDHVTFVVDQALRTNLSIPY